MKEGVKNKMSEKNSLVLVNRTNNLPAVIDTGSLVSYLEKIKKFPVLTEEEENKLLIDFKQNGNLHAAQILTTSHLRLAAKIAMQYRRYGLPLADLISEANIGLMQAVKKFDINKKVRLATYAIWWIKAAINDYILRSWSLVKIGTVSAQKKLFYNLNRIKAHLGIYENKELAPDEVKKIASELVVDESDVVEMNRRMGGDSSLNVAIDSDDEGDERIDMIADKRQNAEMSLAGKQERLYKQKVLIECLRQLSEREQSIIKNRMLCENPKTLEELGEEFGISRERIRQIEKKAFEKLSELVKKNLNPEA